MKRIVPLVLFAACQPPSPPPVSTVDVPLQPEAAPAPVASAAPTPKPTVNQRAKTIAVYGSTGCMIDDGSVYCWKGDEQNGPINKPENRVPLPRSAIDIDTSGSVTCAVQKDGHVFCWGSNILGELGAMSPVERSEKPLQVVNVDDALRVRTGDRHVCALRRNGRVSCWGTNRSGAVSGDVAFTRDARRLVRPVEVEGIDHARWLATGSELTCAGTGDGVFCWGSIRHQQPYRNPTPTERKPLADLDAFSVSARGACGVDSKRNLRCAQWPMPHPMGATVGAPSIDRIVQVEMLDYLVCARDRAGKVYCFEPTPLYNSSGKAPPSNATPIDGLSRAIDLDVGGFKTACARTTTTVMCWEGASPASKTTRSIH